MVRRFERSEPLRSVLIPHPLKRVTSAGVSHVPQHFAGEADSVSITDGPRRWRGGAGGVMPQEPAVVLCRRRSDGHRALARPSHYRATTRPAGRCHRRETGSAGWLSVDGSGGRQGSSRSSAIVGLARGSKQRSGSRGAESDRSDVPRVPPSREDVAGAALLAELLEPAALDEPAKDGAGLMTVEAGAFAEQGVGDRAPLCERQCDRLQFSVGVADARWHADVGRDG